MKHVHQILVGGVSLAALLCLSVPAPADGQAQDRAYIRKAYQNMDQAMGRKDAAGYVAFMRPDYVDIDSAGQAAPGREAKRRGMSRQFAGMTRVTQSTTITHIRFGPQGATVDTSVSGSATTPVDGKEVQFKGGETDRALWVKSGGVWLLKTSRTLTVH